MNNPFDYFDKIYCICGKHEPERWESVKLEFEKIGILDRIERFDEVIDTDWLKENHGPPSHWNKTDYCHYKIIMDAHEQGLENVFIFESDVYFVNTDLELMGKSFESLGEVEWKLFYMGGVPHNVFEVVNEHLIKASMCQAHAYAVNGKYCKEVATKLVKHSRKHIDQVYRRMRRFRLGNHAYATYPLFAIQRDGKLEIKRAAYARRRYKRRVESKMKKYLIENDDE